MEIRTAQKVRDLFIKKGNKEFIDGAYNKKSKTGKTFPP
jgi:hypothetical protein